MYWEQPPIHINVQNTNILFIYFIYTYYDIAHHIKCNLADMQIIQKSNEILNLCGCTYKSI